MLATTYRKRRGSLSRGEREWRVEDDALCTRGPTGRERRYPWVEIVSVRLYHEPRGGRPWRFVFELQPKDRRRVEIDNAHFVARGDFEDRSAAYTPFVRAALERLASTRPQMRALIGETPRRYFALLLGGLLALCALAYALVVVRTPLDALSYAPMLKLGFIGALVFVFWRWVVGALPRGFALDQVPARALPAVAGEEVVPPA